MLVQSYTHEAGVRNLEREIANVIRERVAVDKTVAEEEEAIKRLRLVEDAKRTKEATVIGTMIAPWTSAMEMIDSPRRPFSTSSTG